MSSGHNKILHHSIKLRSKVTVFIERALQATGLALETHLDSNGYWGWSGRGVNLRRLKMHGAVCLHGVPGSAYPFTLILCNMEDQMLPGIHWAGKGKAYSFSLETVRKSGIKQTITHAVSLCSVHDLVFSDILCPLLFHFYGNLQPPFCDPSIPKVIYILQKMIHGPSNVKYLR